MSGRIPLGNHLAQDSYLLGDFWYPVQFLHCSNFSSLGLFKFSVSSCLSVGSVWVSRNLSISSRLSNLLTYNFSECSLMLIFYGVGCHLSCFIPDFIYLGFLSFEKSSHGFINLLILSKNQFLDSLMCSTGFLFVCFLVVVVFLFLFLFASILFLL